MSEERVSIALYAVGVMYNLNVTPLLGHSSELDEQLRQMEGFVGYDDKAAEQYYFYLTPQQQYNAAMEAATHGDSYRVNILDGPVQFYLGKE